MLRSDFKKVERFCLFIGHGRSGHSLIGALLDAHPSMNIAHELDALGLIKRGISRESLFLLYGTSRHFQQHDSEWTGYKYSVPNQYKGEFTTLHVIGDKKGGRSTQRLGEDPTLLTKVHELIDIPMHVIHVKRHPLNNVFTIAQKSYGKKTDLDYSIERYFRRCEIIRNIKNRVKNYERIKWLNLHHESFVCNTGHKLRELCKYLGIEVDEVYLKDCTEIVFNKPNKSRHKVRYKENHISKIKRKASDF